MRKLSKIFALLLTVCLLIGAVSIFSSAAALNASELESGSTGITNAVSYTYENGLYNSLYPYDTTKTKYNSSITSSQNSLPVIGSSMASETVGDETNHYWRYNWGGNVYNKYTEFKYAAAATYAAPDYKYYVFDADFTTDAYLNAEETDVDPEATSGKLAYPEGGGFGFRGNVSSIYITCAFLVSDEDGNWYVANAESLEISTKSVKLDGGIGEWNHITYVFDTAGKYYVYINGAYAWSGTKVANDSNPIATTAAYFRVTTDTARNFSFCVDNVTSNLYSAAYASSDSAYGLDDFLSGNDYVYGIGGVADVVGNSNNCANVAKPANNFKVGSTDYAYSRQALSALKEGGTFIAYSDFTISEFLEAHNYTVVCENGTKLTLADEAAEFYHITSETEVGDTTTYVITLNPRALVADSIQVIARDDFTNATSGLLAFNNTFTNNFNTLVSGTDNKYAEITPKITGALSGNTNAYFVAVTERGVKDADLVKYHSYYAVEFDIATNGDYCEGMSIAVFDNYNGKYITLGYTVSDSEGNWYIANQNTHAAATKTYALPEAQLEWTHITLIATADVTAGKGSISMYINGEYFSTVAATNHSFRMERICMYLPINAALSEGISICTDNFVATAYGTTEKSYNSGADVFGLDDYALLGDNTLPVHFVEDLVFNRLYEFEAPNTPSVDIGLSEKYYNYAAAFAAVSNGDTITLGSDVILYAPLADDIKTLNVTGAGNLILKGEAALAYTYADGVLTKNTAYTAVWTDGTNTVFTQELPLNAAPDPTAVSLSFDKIKGDYKNADAWEISIGGNDYVLLSSVEWTEAEDGSTVTLRPLTGTVSWYEADGETQNGETETWFAGAVTPKSFDSLEALVALNNGWYEWEYKYWNSADADFTLAVGEHKDYVAVKELVSAIDVKFNYTLGSMYYASLYLPEAIEGVTVTSVTNSQVSGGVVKETFESVGAETTVGGVKYTKYNSSTLAIYNWYPYTRFIVTFDAVVDGETVSLTSKNIDTQLPTYLNKVLASYDCGSPEENLVINWLQYITQQYAVQSANNITLGAADSILKNHFTANAECESNLKALADQTPAAADESLTYKNIANLADGFGASYIVFSQSIRLGVYVPVEYADAFENLAVNVSFRGIKDGKTNQKISFNMICNTVEVEEEVDGEPVTKTVKATYDVGGVSAYLYISDTHDIAIYNANEIMTISIIADGETKASGTYSLAEYLYNINSKLPAEPTLIETRNVEAVQGLIAFAKASREYMVYGTEAAE